MTFQSLTTTLLFAAVFFSSGVLTTGQGSNGFTADCSTYTEINSTSATCNNVPGRICSGGCTGYITATNCTTSSEINDPKPPLTSEKCTVSYGRSSATMAICITEKQTFTCYGPPSGSAQCKGCKEMSHKGDYSISGGNASGGGAKGGEAQGGKAWPSTTAGNTTAAGNSTMVNNNTTVDASSPTGNTTTSSSSITQTTVPPSDPSKSSTTSAGTLLGFNEISLAFAVLLFSTLV